jgi:hypothetical protein
VISGDHFRWPVNCVFLLAFLTCVIEVIEVIGTPPPRIGVQIASSGF